MTCEEVQKFIYIYLDGEMEEADRREMMAHITECPACTRMIAVERAALKAVRNRSPRAAPPQWFRDRITARVRGTSAVVLFLREIRVHPVVAAAAAAALLVILTARHAGEIAGPGDAGHGPHSSLSSLLPDVVRLAAHPVVTGGARASLTGAGYFNMNNRVQARKTCAQASRKAHFAAYKPFTYDCRTVAARPASPMRGFRLAHGQSLNAPTLGGYGVMYARADAPFPLDPDEMVYDDITE